MADDMEVEIYTPERIAEFLLNNAGTQEEWYEAAEEIRSMGLDPGQIEHTDPHGREKLQLEAEWKAKVVKLQMAGRPQQQTS